MVKANSMMADKVSTIDENANVIDAANLMLKKKVSTLMVIRKDKSLSIVTEKDLIKATLNKSSSKSKIKTIANKNFLKVNEDTTYSYIIQKLRKGNIQRFPVVTNKKLVGIITETDIIDTTRDFIRFHQIVQEVILTLFGLATAFFLFFFSPLGQSLRDLFV